MFSINVLFLKRFSNVFFTDDFISSDKSLVKTILMTRRLFFIFVFTDSKGTNSQIELSRLLVYCTSKTTDFDRFMGTTQMYGRQSYVINSIQCVIAKPWWFGASFQLFSLGLAHKLLNVRETIVSHVSECVLSS